MALASRPSVAAKPAKVHLLVAVAFAVAVVPLFVAPTLVETVGRDTTFSGRTAIWSILPTLVQNHWLGAGYETFLMGPRLVRSARTYGYVFQEAHNGYLEVYLNLGWIGVFLFACLLISGYRKIVAADRAGSCRLQPWSGVFYQCADRGLNGGAVPNDDTHMFFLLWAIISASKGAISPNRAPRRSRSTARAGDYTNEVATRIPV